MVLNEIGAEFHGVIPPAEHRAQYDQAALAINSVRRRRRAPSWSGVEAKRNINQSISYRTVGFVLGEGGQAAVGFLNFQSGLPQTPCEYDGGARPGCLITREIGFRKWPENIGKNQGRKDQCL